MTWFYITMIVMPTFCLLLGYFAGKRRAIETNKSETPAIDYKQRWEEAVVLLGDIGRLTDEEVKRITSGESFVSKEQEQFYGMYSSDRKKIAIDRARAGLPPNDNLVGMHSSDVRKVIAVRQNPTLR